MAWAQVTLWGGDRAGISVEADSSGVGIAGGEGELSAEAGFDARGTPVPFIGTKRKAKCWCWTY